MKLTNRLRFVYSQLKSTDQTLDKTSFEFFNLVRTAKISAINGICKTS